MTGLVACGIVTPQAVVPGKRATEGRQNMAKVITARRADKCGECGGAIAAGEKINYGGPGAVSHEHCRPLQSVRTRYGRRVYGGADYTGRRCEDAPCCGCC